MGIGRGLGVGVLAVAVAVAAVAACSSSDGPGDGATGGDGGRDPDAGASGQGDGAAADTGVGTLPPGDPGDGAPPVHVDAGACATRLGARGLTTHQMTVAGLARSFLVYLPPNVAATQPVPLVVAHHGWAMSAAEMRAITDLTTLADAEGFAAVFPEGESGPGSLLPPWNCGQNVCPTTAVITPVASGDDLAFLAAIQADVAEDQCVDAAHVFVTGFSMGGYFAHHVGCNVPSVRAIAPHSGGTHDLSACPVARKPVIIFHGDKDDTVPDGCDDPNGTNTPLGFTPSATAWAKHNGCAATVTTTPVTNGECRLYDGCPADGQVEICILHGMSHCWAGGPADAGDNACPGYASATALEWAFFKKYAW